MSRRNLGLVFFVLWIAATSLAGDYDSIQVFGARKASERQEIEDYFSKRLNFPRKNKAFLLGLMVQSSVDLQLGDISNAIGHISSASRALGNPKLAAGRGALSVVFSEGYRQYHGEPFERMALFYYLGVLDYMAGHFENARIGFSNALLCDTVGKNPETYQDAALIHFFLGLTYRHLGQMDNCRIAFKKAVKYRPELANFVADSAKSNLIVVSEIGLAPFKKDRGLGLSEYLPVLFPDQRLEVIVNNKHPIEGEIALDFFHQASSIGKTKKDSLQAGKNVVALIAGIVAPLALASLCYQSTGSANADLRSWNSLPGEIAIAVGSMPVGENLISVGFKGPNNEVSRESIQTINISVGPREEVFVYLPSHLASTVLDLPNRVTRNNKKIRVSRRGRKSGQSSEKTGVVLLSKITKTKEGV